MYTINPIFGLAILALAVVALAAQASGVPADAAVDPASPHKTLKPKVSANSGRLEWVAHERDFTPWLTLSRLDRRETPRPRKVELAGPLNGDAERGRAIAFSGRGNCLNCHELPGDDWPGTFGSALVGYGRHQHRDADVYQQVFDARLFNPNSVMPPYGTFGLLSEQDIRDLVAYLQSLK